MQVLKLGGTSVANAQHINKVRDIVSRHSTSGPLIVIVSALSGTTARPLRLDQMAAEADTDYEPLLRQMLQQRVDGPREGGETAKAGA